jgi:hypothetical protein
MKSNKEILEYLKPYTEMDGMFLLTKVEVYEKYDNQLIVKIDIKRSFDKLEKPYAKADAIKQMLRNNGFLYHYYSDSYNRPWLKKDWPKVKKKETANEKYERTLRMMGLI